MQSPLLAKLAAAGRLWRGAGTATRTMPAVATGYPPLDDRLGGGWPLGCLVEILAAPVGAGELQLLLPALAELTGTSTVPPPPVVLIAPPHLPYPPGCLQQGLDPQRLVVVDPGGGQASAAALWAMEEFLAADACVAAVAWVGPASRPSLQRLQLAASSGRTLAVVVRAAHFRAARSAAALRLLVEPAPAGLAIEIARNRFGATGRLALALA